jgi:hypothetical protein
MSDPEIARRCAACGVSVRHHAMFCPQCGNPISGQAQVTTSNSLSDTVMESVPNEVVRPDLAATQPLSALTPLIPESAATQALGSAPPAHKVSEDGVRARVERLRKVSSVVLDQAAYDPSLRFLLVAAGFFLLFLVLLILSKVIG